MAMIDLRLGRWEASLVDVGEVDCVCADPPFSPRVHSGQRTGSSTRKTTLTYDELSEQNTVDFCKFWTERSRYWILLFSDHLAQRWWEAALTACDWYVFAPVLAIRTCPTPRMAGDGPTSACDYITVARRKRRLPPNRRGSRPGYYMVPHMNGNAYAQERYHPGGKDLGLMRALIRDYTCPGDTVVDPTAGGATTLIAAHTLGRKAIGAEMDPATYAKAQARIDRHLRQGTLFEPAAMAVQARLEV